MTYAERIEQFNRASHSDPLREMQGLYADRLPARETSLPELAARLVAASSILRTASEADWSRANDAHAEAQAAFRAAVQRAVGMPLAVFERAMGEI